MISTLSPALAHTLELPNGNTVEGLPEAMAPAGKSGVVVVSDEGCLLTVVVGER